MNADLSMIHLSTVTTLIPPYNIDHLSHPQQINLRIGSSLHNDLVLSALVYYDLQHHVSVIHMDCLRFIDRRFVHWEKNMSTKLIHRDENDELERQVVDTMATQLSGLLHMPVFNRNRCPAQTRRLNNRSDHREGV